MKLTCPRHPASPARGIALALLATTSLSVAALSAAPAYAQQATSYDIAAGPLPTVLNQFARQAHVELIYDAPLTQSATSSGLKGSFGAAEGLSRILAGTGLTYRQTGPNVFTLERAPTADVGAVQLGAVRVAGDATGGSGSSRPVPAIETSSSYVPSYSVRLSTTATKTDTPILETPQSISVVTREALDTQGATNLTDALRYTAGISTAAYLNGNGDNYDIFTIRGFSNSNSGVLRDGMRLNYNAFDAPSETYGFERIEILKGPAGVIYGQSGPSGAVNLVSKRPTVEPLHEIELQGGTFDRYQAATDHSGRIDPDGVFSYRLTALYRDSGGWTDFGKNNRLYIAPALRS